MVSDILGEGQSRPEERLILRDQVFHIQQQYQLRYAGEEVLLLLEPCHEVLLRVYPTRGIPTYSYNGVYPVVRHLRHNTYINQ